jgi:ribosome-associated toxin RatA of RatAB toxin-antitoxin module
MAADVRAHSTSPHACSRREAREKNRLSVVEKSVLVGYSAHQMFGLVDAVEAYPQFLPWCDDARVIHRDDTRTRATLHINYHGAKQSFTTENAKEPPHRMTVKLVEGPFRVLDGEWRFTPLREDACKIEFRLHYEFASKVLEMLVGPVFSYIANTMVEAFVKRADQLYGG